MVSNQAGLKPSLIRPPPPSRIASWRGSQVPRLPYSRPGKGTRVCVFTVPRDPVSAADISWFCLSPCYDARTIALFVLPWPYLVSYYSPFVSPIASSIPAYLIYYFIIFIVYYLCSYSLARSRPMRSCAYTWCASWSGLRTCILARYPRY
jgi:hypothetical protein